MTITVLMTAYNADRFLAEAIESVLAQTYRDFGFIIVDDGSTDNTLAIARSYASKDERIDIISHSNIGMGRSMNEAMRQASGQWICRLDADDVMEPNRLNRQIAFLRTNPDVVVASSLIHYIDDTGRTIGRYVSRFTTRDAVAESARSHRPVGFHHSAVIMRKEIILGLGGYRPAFWPADDMDLWNRVVEAGYMVLVQPEYLTRYRIHGSSVTISSSCVTEQKAQWVEACMEARRNAQAEPTWEQFSKRRLELSWYHRANSRRRDHARALYKAAVLNFSRRKYGTSARTLLAALTLEPSYVLPRVLPQLKRVPRQPLIRT